MKTSVFSIKDNKVATFNTPFACPSAIHAKREFLQAVRQGSSPVAAFPADFDLYYLGEIDLDTGVMTSRESGPQYICNGTEAKNDA